MLTHITFFFSCIDTYASILRRKPNKEPQNMKNHEVLENFVKEKLFSKIYNQGEEDSLSKLQGNKANSYTLLNLQNHGEVDS